MLLLLLLLMNFHLAKKRPGAGAYMDWRIRGLRRRSTLPVNLPKRNFRLTFKKHEESDGFDIGEVPDDVLMPIPMPVPLDVPAYMLRPYNKMAKKAIGIFNEKEGKTYKFVKLVRANGLMTAGTDWQYHVTFQAKERKPASPPQNFQTAVLTSKGDIRVHFCRVEPAKGPGETSEL